MDARIRAFVAQQREWLEVELHAEQEEPATAASATGTTPTRHGDSSSVPQQQQQHVLHHLQVDSVTVGLYGRTVVRFTPTTETSTSTTTIQPKKGLTGSLSLLPSHRFTTGDEVEIRTKSSSKKSHGHAPAGVVSAVTEDSISVALVPSKRKGSSSSKTNGNNDDGDDNDDDDDEMMLGGSPPYSLIPRSNVEVHRKLLAALDELATHGTSHPVAGNVVQALFEAPAAASSNIISSSPVAGSTSNGWTPNNPNLDESQLEAIRFALQQNQSLSLIHGPPGTGKTTTVVELIQQAVQQYKWKVLVTAPSNVAVDNVLAKLVATPIHSTRTTTTTSHSRSKSKKMVASPKLQVVRLGHPARLQEAILPYSLEARVQDADGTEIVAQVRAELQSYLKLLASPRRYGREQKRLAYREVQALRKEVRQREEKTVQTLLTNAQVVLATCVGAANHKLLREQHFDLVVIDEAAQALEAACWIPALRAGTKLVLAGDHCQLPPTIQSNVPAIQQGLGHTMFERAMALYGDTSGGTGRVSRMLRVQYRMHQCIADWASRALYGGELQTHASVATRTLGELAHARPAGIGALETDGLQDTPLLLLDTAGCALYEAENAAGSRYNEGEAELVVKHARKLILDMNIPPDQIAVISPYNGQVEILRLALLPEFPKLQIRSVDGFQGGEREAVIISLVRSSDRGGRNGIGFLRDNRRLNVAVTRAKRHCCIICDTETVSQSSFVKNLITWVEEHGEQRSALELDDNMDNDAAQMNADLAVAELEIERLIQQEINDAHKKANPSKVKRTVSPAEMERRRETLLERIQGFQSNAEPGETMIMSNELSKLDRKLVHEIAEELGLSHQSKGEEGVDRHITLGIPLQANNQPKSDSAPVNAGATIPLGVAPPSSLGIVEPGLADGDNQTSVEVLQPAISAFSALESDEDDSDPDVCDCLESKEAGGCVDDMKPVMNSVLSDFAKERAQREKQKSAKEVTSTPKKKSATKRNGKLGGTKKAAPNEDEVLDDLDDMAFLEAQVNKVQTSHGRTINASGSSYRTIVNGVLLNKPNKPPPKKKDPKASAALQEKLKKAQEGRKTKTKAK